MTLFRVQHNKNYTCINNTICTDIRLSWKAKGIWLYAFSRPNDWSFYLSDLVNQSIDGKDSVRAGLKELEDSGYLKRNRFRNEKGQLCESEWVFSEIPFSIGLEPKSDNPTLDNPTLDNPTLISTDVLPSTKKVNIKGNALDDEKTMPSKFKEIKGCKFPLKKDQEKILNSLKELKLECDNKTLAILIRTHKSEKILEAITHLKFEIGKGTKFKISKIAFFRHLLSGKVSMVNSDVLKNKKFAESMKKKLNWSDLSIHDKFVICDETKTEIPLNFSQEDFFNKLKELAERTKQK